MHTLDSRSCSSLHVLQALPNSFVPIFGLECCQVVDFPQQLPSEALEARQQLSSILQPTAAASASTSSSEQVCTLMRHSAGAGGLVMTQEQPGLGLLGQQVTLRCWVTWSYSWP